MNDKIRICRRSLNAILTRFCILEHSISGWFREVEDAWNRQLWACDAGPAQVEQNTLCYENIRQTKSKCAHPWICMKICRGKTFNNWEKKSLKICLQNWEFYTITKYETTRIELWRFMNHHNCCVKTYCLDVTF